MTIEFMEARLREYIEIARALGYELALDVGYYSSARRCCCPLGAVLLAQHAGGDGHCKLQQVAEILGVDEQWAKEFTDGFDAFGGACDSDAWRLGRKFRAVAAGAP